MTALDFTDRVALVTGAGRGLGRAHTVLLAARGASVVAADLPGSDVAAVVDRIEQEGGAAVAVFGDVSRPEDGGALVAAAVDAFGRIDIVINNAGITRDQTFGKLSDENLDIVLRVHLYGAFNVTRPAWRLMRDQGFGRILNTTSNAGILGNFGQSNYAAAKMGLVGLTRTLALEGRRYDINVNALAPMGRTPMTEGIRWDVFEAFDPDLVAPVAAWLVHPDCTSTGEVFSAAGGRVARYVVGLTPGYHDAALTPEQVRDNFDRIRRAEGFTEPASAEEEIEELARRFAAEERR